MNNSVVDFMNNSVVDFMHNSVVDFMNSSVVDFMNNTNVDFNTAKVYKVFAVLFNFSLISASLLDSHKAIPLAPSPHDDSVPGDLEFGLT